MGSAAHFVDIIDNLKHIRTAIAPVFQLLNRRDSIGIERAQDAMVETPGNSSDRQSESSLCRSMAIPLNDRTVAASAPPDVERMEVAYCVLSNVAAV
jgi:hypothetical protein